MRPAMTTAAGAVAALVLTSACALVASKREYGMFRQITQTQDPVELASLYKSYVTQFPQGAYSAELSKMRPEMERELFMAAGEDRELLRMYVEVFPNGIYAKLASDKIGQIEAAIAWQQEQAAAIEAQRAAELKAAEDRRQAMLAAFNGAFAGWIAFAGQAPYGKTVEQIAGSSPWFLELWSTEPLATCDATSCVKHYLFDTWYQNTGGTRVNSVLEMAVKLVFDSGNLVGLSVTLPRKGVLPLLEQRDQVPLDLSDESLDEATAMVIDSLRIAASEAMPDGQEQEQLTPGVLWAWTSPQARLSFVRRLDPVGGVTDALIVELVPPPPPEPPPPPPGVKPPKPKKPPKGEPVAPQPPVVNPADLVWNPAPAAPPEAVPVVPAATPDPEKAPADEPSETPPAALPGQPSEPGTVAGG